MRVAWLLHFSGLQGVPAGDPTEYRFWSGGDGALNFEGASWGVLGRVVTISPLEVDVDNLQEERVSLSISVTDAAERAQMLVDRGPYSGEIGLVASADDRTWARVPFRFAGRVSAPRWRAGVMSVVIESYTATVDKGRPIYWTHESHSARNPGDTFFEHAAEIARGLDDLDWPPKQGD